MANVFDPPPRLAGGPIILVAGPPASGKGTQCKRIASQCGFAHISIGDLVRDQASAGTDAGIAVKGFMDNCQFVPDDLMLDMVKARLSMPDIGERGVLLDGFPRSREQAEALIAAYDVKAFILFQVRDDDVVLRALGRGVDPETGSIYHNQFLPAPAEVEPRLTIRDSDCDEKTIRGRLQIYSQYIATITPLFQSKTHCINGEMRPDEVFESVKQVIAALSSTAATTKVEDDDWSDDEEVTQGPGLQLQLEAAPCVNIGAEGGESMVTVSIRVPENEAGCSELPRSSAGRVLRPPTDVCCVVDISGSMSQEATYEDENENVKSDGLTYLDIVKHAVKTVAHMLSDQDRLALVAFDNNATLVFALDYMTADGRTHAVAALETLQPQGRTDIWKGLHTGLEALRAVEETADWRAKTVLLLTDGVPNEVPPKGHITELRDYKECHPDFSFMINTFGFGYKLDSQLLLDLAVEGQGTYGFIPDALIVGTSFVDSIANVLSTHTQKATVHLTAKAGAGFAGPILGVGAQMVTETSWGRVLNLGPLQFGSTRDVVVPMVIPAGDEPYLEAVVVYPAAHGREYKASAQASSRAAAAFAIAGFARSDAVDVGYEAVRQASSHLQGRAQNDMAALIQRMANLEASGGEWVTVLKEDIAGRASKALLGSDRFNRWGKHYLRAFTRAHQVQYCTNFMDKSLQVYGGALFRALREEGDSIFVSLPAPKPSAVKPVVSAARRMTAPAGIAAAPTPAAARRAPSPDMNVYYGGSGGG